MVEDKGVCDPLVSVLTSSSSIPSLSSSSSSIAAASSSSSRYSFSSISVHLLPVIDKVS